MSNAITVMGVSYKNVSHDMGIYLLVFHSYYICASGTVISYRQLTT